MCGIMWDYKCGYVCTVCVTWWSQIDIYMCDMISGLILIVCYMCGFQTCCDAGIFVCSFEYYVWLYWMLCYVYMWITFLLYLQHFLRTFWKYCIFVCFRILSLVISCLFSFSRFFIISQQLTILYIQFNCSLGGMS